MVTTLPDADAEYPEAVQLPFVRFVQLLIALTMRLATVFVELEPFVVPDKISLPLTLMLLIERLLAELIVIVALAWIICPGYRGFIYVFVPDSMRTA
jgi:hypothetical protein